MKSDEREGKTRRQVEKNFASPALTKEESQKRGRIAIKKREQ